MSHGFDVLEAALKRMVEEDGVAAAALEQAINGIRGEFG
jgi:hypothetical protein